MLDRRSSSVNRPQQGPSQNQRGPGDKKWGKTGFVFGRIIRQELFVTEPDCVTTLGLGGWCASIELTLCTTNLLYPVYYQVRAKQMKQLHNRVAALLNPDFIAKGKKGVRKCRFIAICCRSTWLAEVRLWIIIVIS